MIDLSTLELGPKMQACTELERKFVYAMTTGLAQTPTEAARMAGYADPGPQSSAIRVKAHHLMHKDRVIEAIEEVSRQHFRGLVVPAIAAMKAMINKPDHPDHAKMVNSLLSRLGFGEKTGIDVTVQGEVQVNHTDAALENLRIMLAMGVPREKLVEVFGHSGLDRYEKMLPKVIEHKPNET